MDLLRKHVGANERFDLVVGVIADTSKGQGDTTKTQKYCGFKSACMFRARCPSQAINAARALVKPARMIGTKVLTQITGKVGCAHLRMPQFSEHMKQWEAMCRQGGKFGAGTHAGVLIAGVVMVKGVVCLSYTYTQDFTKCAVLFARKQGRGRKAFTCLFELFQRMLERWNELNGTRTLPCVIHLFRKDNIDDNLRETALAEERDAMNKGIAAFTQANFAAGTHPPQLFVNLFNAKTKIETSSPLPAMTYVAGNDTTTAHILETPREFLLQYNDPRKPNQPNRLAKVTVLPNDVATFDSLRHHPANSRGRNAYENVLKYNIWVTLRTSFAYINWPGMISWPHVLQYARNGAEFMVDGVMTYRSGAYGDLTNGPPRRVDGGGDEEIADYFRKVNNHIRQSGLDGKHFMI